jgi:ankyrin repeat protein
MPGQFVTMSELERNFNTASELHGPWGALPAAVHCGNRAITRLLLENNASPNGIDAYGWASLHSAVSKGLDLAQLLLENDANIRDKHGCTPLHWAVAGSVVMAHAGGWSSTRSNITIQEDAVVLLLQHFC